ncbi:hypothetical protein L9F63_024005, partial [Diploptera punctata]
FFGIAIFTNLTLTTFTLVQLCLKFEIEDKNIVYSLLRFISYINLRMPLSEYNGISQRLVWSIC